MNSTELVLGQAYFWLCAVTRRRRRARARSLRQEPDPRRDGPPHDDPRRSPGIYLALHAQFLAAIQLIVYAGRDRRPLPLRHHAARPRRDRRRTTTRGASRARSARVALRGRGPRGDVAHRPHRAADREGRRSSPRRPRDFGSVEAFGRDPLHRRARAVRALERAADGRHHRRRRGRARPPQVGPAAPGRPRRDAAHTPSPRPRPRAEGAALARVSELETEAST